MNIGGTHAIGGKFEVEALSVVVSQFAAIDAQNIEDVNKNTDRVIADMERAAYAFPGYDLFVAQECCFQGFSRVIKQAVIDIDGPQIRRVQEKCAELGVWAVINPFLNEVDGKPICNTVLMINSSGEIVHKYVKMNLWIPGETAYPGWTVPVTEGPKGSRIATIDCADGDYPEIWREAAYNGANVIIRVAHYPAPWDQAWKLTNRAAAYFNQSYVVGCNSVGSDCFFNYFGNSMVVNPDGNIITEAPLGQEWLFKADLYPQIIDKLREKGSTNNFLYSFNHRGASNPELGGFGDTVCRYRAYSPESWGERKAEDA